MKKKTWFLVLYYLPIMTFAQNVGIGTSTPSAGLHINSNNGLLSTGTVGAGTDLIESGAGAKLIWHPKKSAFRAGSSDNTSWNDSLVGYYSVAMGRFPVARGISSIALGENNTAYSGYSVGIGQFNTVNSEYSVAIGNNNQINLPRSFAYGNNISVLQGDLWGTVGNNFSIGNQLSSKSDSSFAIGNGLRLTGLFPGTGIIKTFVIGNDVSAYNDWGFAIGNGGLTRGDSSFSFGNYAGTAGNKSFAIGNNTASLGVNSFSLGNNAIVQSFGSDGFAIGNGATSTAPKAISIGNTIQSFSGTHQNLASGTNSIAIGNGSSSIAPYSMSMGLRTSAEGERSVAMGYFAKTSGIGSIAIGTFSEASGTDAIAMGSSVASSQGSFAIGNFAYANGDYSTAMGLYSSNGNHFKSFVINGSSNASPSNLTANTLDNQMMMNFNDYIFWCNTPGKIVRFSSNGDICASGNITGNSVSCFSDSRLKKNITTLTGSLQHLMSVKGYQYNWIDSSKGQTLQTGVLAQEVKRVFPELVSENEEGIMSVNYIGFIPHLLESVKTLKIENDEMRKEIAELKKLILSTRTN